MSSQIDHLLNEDRRFAPSDDFAANAVATARSLRRAPPPTARGSGPTRRATLHWHTPFTAGARLVEPAVRELVRRRRAQRRLQLPRPARRSRQRRPRRAAVGGRARRRPPRDLRRAHRRGQAPRERARGTRHRRGRPRRDLHADDPRGDRRDARRRAHRRDPLRRLRRLLGRQPALAHRRRRREARHHRRRRLPQGQGLAAQARRRHGARPTATARACRRPSSTCSSSRAAATTSSGPRAATSGGTTSCRRHPPSTRRRRSPPRTRCSSSIRRARPESRRASCTPRAATSPRRPSRNKVVHDIHPEIRRVLVHGRHRLGHRPQLRRPTARSRTARRRCSTRARPTPRIPGRWWEIVAEVRRDDPLHRAHRHPLVHEARPRDPEEVRPVVAAAARLGGRAHQPRGVDVVPQDHRRQDRADRRHVVADRDRRDHDLGAARA